MEATVPPPAWHQARRRGIQSQHCCTIYLRKMVATLRCACCIGSILVYTGKQAGPGHSYAQAQNMENKTATLGPSTKFSTCAQKRHSSNKQINKIGDGRTTCTNYFSQEPYPTLTTYTHRLARNGKFSTTNGFTIFIQLCNGKSGGALFLFLGANRVQTVGARR